MNKKVLTGLFFLVLLGDLICIQLRLDAFRYVTKPLIVLSLLSYFISRVQPVQSSSKWWIVGALIFSWLGDVFLLLETHSTLFFIFGLSSFLLAHIGYCWFFNHVRRREAIKTNLFFILFVVVYYTALMRLLTPSLGSLKLPVWIYGVVICTMLGLALHLHKVYRHNTGLFMVLGALLFVLSDSVLAVNKFHQPVSWAGVIIMLTYGLAQWFIVEGSSCWLLNQQAAKSQPVFEEQESAAV